MKVQGPHTLAVTRTFSSHTLFFCDQAEAEPHVRAHRLPLGRTPPSHCPQLPLWAQRGPCEPEDPGTAGSMTEGVCLPDGIPEPSASSFLPALALPGGGRRVWWSCSDGPEGSSLCLWAPEDVHSLPRPLGDPVCSSSPSYQRTSVSSRPSHSLGRVCCANVHLLEPQLGALQGLAQERPGWAKPSSCCRSATARELASSVAIPQCTVPQRERACHGHPGDRPPHTGGQPVTALLTRRQRPGHPRAPSVFTFVSREEPAV